MIKHGQDMLTTISDDLMEEMKGQKAKQKAEVMVLPAEGEGKAKTKAPGRVVCRLLFSS
jgi:hypothetical protein